MNLVCMKGPFPPLMGYMYDFIVASAIEPLYRKIADRVLEEVSEGTVLDVGCGPGHLAMMLAQDGPGLSVTASDLSGSIVEKARNEALRRGFSNLTFDVSDAMSLPYPDECFDLVLSIASIKHWQDKEKGLAELIRVLRTGGLLVVVEVDRRCSYRSARAFVSRWRMAYCTPLLAGYFRLVIAGQSLDMYEMKRLMDRTALSGCSIYTDADAPVFVVEARKPGGCQ